MQTALFRHIVCMKNFYFFLREYLFPFGCSICGADLLSVSEALYGLCEDCKADIERELEENRMGEVCDYCGKPLISEHGRCLSCREGEGLSYDWVKVLFPYTGKYRMLLAAYKFSKNPAVGNFLAEKILDALSCEAFPPEAAIVPVPPRPGKIRKMGWDQVEYLARLLKKNKRSPAIVSCLKRMPSKSQKELSRENRRSNLRGRIVTVRQVPQVAVVLDDVMTTGSTLDACAAALKEAGTQAVYGLCLFYD